MLFVLTGQVQTGKTRWLQSLVEDLESSGVVPYGVIAPGVWADRRSSVPPSPHADANGFEKLGIDNVLLPGHEHIPFARRADLARDEGTYDAGNQSAKAGLSWHIDDNALAHVNDHLACLPIARAADDAQPVGILIIDELGLLELERGGGLTQAIRLLDAGPTPHMRHALVVVREGLLPHLENRFGRWGETSFVRPDPESHAAVIRAATMGQ